MFASLRSYLLLLPAVALLSACNSTQDNSLFGDKKSDVCPTGCVDSLTADDSQIAIKIMNPTIAMISGQTRVDISGQCYASLYPTNKIFISVLNSAQASLGGISYVALTETGGQPVCVNGRFNIAIDFSAVTTAGTYTVQAKLVAYESTGQQHQNSSDGISYVNVQKP